MFVIPPALDRSVTGAVYGFALLKGGKPERMLAGLIAAIWFWHSFVHPYWLTARSTYQLTLDIAVLLATFALALRYSRWWLLVAAMAGVLRTATDIASFIIPLRAWTYGTALIVWGYVFLAALTTGTWASWQGRRAGRDPSRFRSSTPPEPRAGFAAGLARSGRSSAG